jgi:DNA-binding CsgD family transcriptional regulator
MVATATARRAEVLIDRCHAGLDVTSLRTEALLRIRRLVSVDAAFFATVDPATLLFTSAVAEEPLAEARTLFLDNEFGRADVNKFAALAEAADPVGSLDRATLGDRSASARYREIMAPLGLGDELRAALISGTGCWGVLCLHREDASTGFDSRDLALVRRIAPHLAEGLRRAVTVESTAAGTPAPAAPGIIVLDAGLAVVSMNPEANAWLAETEDAGRAGPGGLPLAVQAAATRLSTLEEAAPTLPASATVRLRGRSGRWFALHATRLHGPREPQIGIVIEPASPAETGSLLLSAYGLTEAQTRVAALVVRGCSTRQIVRELHISANTVQEHLTAVFDRVGVRSRRELVATVLADRGRS